MPVKSVTFQKNSKNRHFFITFFISIVTLLKFNNKLTNGKINIVNNFLKLFETKLWLTGSVFAKCQPQNWYNDLNVIKQNFLIVHR